MAHLKDKIKFTYQDYLHMPSEKRCELIEGEFRMVPSPNTYHQKILGNLGFFLLDFIKKKKIGWVFLAPYDVVLSEENVVQPDVLYISKEHSPIITDQNVKGAPDLVVEILSEATAYQDLKIKRRLYAKFGVKEYWLVDPKEKSVEVMRLGETGFDSVGRYKNQDLLTSSLLPGLKINLKEVFEEK